MIWNEYTEVNPETILVDRYSDGNGGYQRVPRKALVDKIVSNLDTKAFGAVLVANRQSGDQYAVDGGHRIEAAKILRLRTIPAVIFNSSGPEDEAKVFSLINTNRKALTSVDLYYASISEGNEQSIAIYNFLKSINVHVSHSGNVKDSNRLKFISLLRDRWNNNANACRMALIFMKHTKETLYGPLFSALWYLENKGIGVRVYLEKYLSSGGLVQFKKVWVQFSDFMRSPGSDTHKLYAECFLKMVNRGKSKNRIEI